LDVDCETAREAVRDQLLSLVRELTPWSATLGSEAARALLAELSASGEITAPPEIPRAAMTDLPLRLRD